MGRVNKQEASNQQETVQEASNQPEPVLQHFSHVHPLLLHTEPQQGQIQCNGCNLPSTGLVYKCTPCNYFLHKSCAQIPQQIHHPSHPQHPLSLVATPTYPDGSFSCDACGQHGTAFSFHCFACEFDLHTHCAIYPRRINHQAHPHPLILTYTFPFVGFPTCDICRGGIGSNNWRYRCAACDFDGHLGCATSQAPPPQQQQFNHSPQGQGSSSGVEPISAHPLLQTHTALVNDYTAQIMLACEAQRKITEQMFKSKMEEQNRLIAASLNSYPNNVQTILQTPGVPPHPNNMWADLISRNLAHTAPAAVPPGPNRAWADLLSQNLSQMSLNNNNNGGIGIPGGGFGSIGNQGGSTAPNNLTEMMNGFDWSDMISTVFDVASGFM